MSRKERISIEEKVKVIQEYLDGKVGYMESVKRGGCNETTFRWRVRRYQAEGVDAFLPHERNRYYSPELKLQAVQDYLAGEGSQEEIARKYHLRSAKQLRSWIKVYNAHGDFNSVKFSGGGSYMKQGRETTQEERLEIVRDCIASGKNYGAMAVKYKVSYQQVRSWTLRFKAMGEAGLEDRRGKRKRSQTPRTELEKAQIEIEQLKHKRRLSGQCCDRKLLWPAQE